MYKTSKVIKKVHVRQPVITKKKEKRKKEKKSTFCTIWHIVLHPYFTTQLIEQLKKKKKGIIM